MNYCPVFLLFSFSVSCSMFFTNPKNKVEHKKGTTFLDRQYYEFSNCQEMYCSDEILESHIKKTCEKMKEFEQENKVKMDLEKKDLISAYYLYRIFDHINKKNKENIKGIKHLRRLTKEILPSYIPDEALYEKDITSLRWMEHKNKTFYEYHVVYGDGRYLKDLLCECESGVVRYKYESLKIDHKKLKSVLYQKKQRRSRLLCLLTGLC